MLNIRNPRTDRLARELAEATGESITEAVGRAVEERLARVRGIRRGEGLAYEIRAIQARVRELPVLDPRTPDEILGYDARGLPR
jgi:antitoxin VapB